ncbi:hypothetical protein BKA82DRAFT_991312 [Pisolithus tinctorius]|uniref:Uncharacterized protein n=1 Tax=Pisolithus tinctorius Marx 270 TaxID=870435 RepID=A0A0C3KYE4_PISTI|nr:hypothetical protein BKA82DRAFT_991312 [Pisolithus tinctorius]KIO14552.1 hypothetical protein M404DRAFT_991312 [Pisolithus tinctorius Marx 270]
MDELAKVRAKLVLLEEQERRLLERPRNVRSVVKAQKKGIVELVKHLIPSLISCLTGAPSKIWLECRVVEVTSPGLWATIATHSAWSTSLALAHVDRSCKRPDMDIRDWFTRSNLSKFLELLGLVISCVPLAYPRDNSEK